MISIDAKMLISSKINAINKITDAQKQLDEFIFTKNRIQDSINDELDDLFAKVMLISRKKENKKALFKKIDQMTFFFHNEDEAAFNKELLLQYVEDKVNDLYWFDQEIIKLYIKHGNYRAIQKETGIPWISTYKTIQKAFEQIRKEIPGEISAKKSLKTNAEKYKKIINPI